MSYSKECLNLIDHSIAEIDKHRNIKLSETDVYAFMTQIKDCDSDMVIMAINNNSTKTAKKRHEFLTMDRIPPKVE